MNSKTIFALLAVFALLSGSSFAQEAVSEEETPLESAGGTSYEAAVNANHVHVRGRPSIYSQIFGQVDEGDRVIVLEELTRTNLLRDEPADWSRIILPIEAAVWVSDSYVDPSSNTVTADVLNVRAGPGPEYGIVAELQEGDSVTVISAENGWLEIVAPEDTEAYIASMYLDPAPDGPAEDAEVVSSHAAPADSSSDAGEPGVAGVTPTEPEPVLPVEEEPVSSGTDIVIIESESFEELPPLTPIEPFDDEPMPVVDTEPLPEVAPPIVIETEENDAPRIVTREGIVGSFVSITAPTYFKLINVHNKATMNYIFTENPRVNLKDFEGRRIVVKGEEFIHKRWPATPVLKILELNELR